MLWGKTCTLVHTNTLSSSLSLCEAFSSLLSLSHSQTHKPQSHTDGTWQIDAAPPTENIQVFTSTKSTGKKKKKKLEPVSPLWLRPYHKTNKLVFKVVEIPPSAVWPLFCSGWVHYCVDGPSWVHLIGQWVHCVICHRMVRPEAVTQPSLQHS